MTATMWVALYVDCFRGKFIPIGPFTTEAEARDYGDRQKDPSLWEAIEVKEPSQ